jgi:hypothetical protein
MTSIPRFLVDIARKRLRGDGQPGLPSWVSMQSSAGKSGQAEWSWSSMEALQPPSARLARFLPPFSQI